MKDYIYFVAYHVEYSEPSISDPTQRLTRGYFGNIEVPLCKRITHEEDIRGLEQFFYNLFMEAKPKAESVSVVIISYNLLRVRRPLTSSIQQSLVASQLEKLLE